MLGAEIRQRRGDRSLDSLAEEVGLTQMTLSRVERGRHTLSLETARALAKWLGWTVEQVAAAAEQPAEVTAQ